MTSYASAQRLGDAEGRQYHIGLAPGEVAPWILLVGDPDRARLVAERFEKVELTRGSREYVTITGVHEGLRVSVMGTGMGAGNTEIAVIELAQIVERPTLLRCGSCGGLQPDIELGDLVITSGACRLENASAAYVDDGYPAVASPEVVMALVRAADELGARHHVGVTATAAGFYGAQGRVIPGLPRPRDPAIVDRLAAQGVKNLEMETSCLLTMATVCGLRAGAICAVYASRTRDAFVHSQAKEAAELSCVRAGLRALHLLEAMDRARGSKPCWHPGLEER